MAIDRRTLLTLAGAGATSLTAAYCVARSNHQQSVTEGGELWHFKAADSIDSSPTVAGDTVVVGSRDHHLYAVDANTGEKRWHFETGDRVRSSPAVVDSAVFVGSDDANLYAVDAETGDEQWRFETDDPLFSSPTVADGTVFVGSFDNHLYAVEAGVAGSSIGSRVRLETLGHHDATTANDR